jgi:hypothetical protein
MNHYYKPTRHFDQWDDAINTKDKNRLIEEMLYMINLPVKSKSDILLIHLLLDKVDKETDYLKI